MHVLKRADGVYEDEPRLYTELVKRYGNVCRVLPGRAQEEYPEFTGNSVLLDLGGLRFAYVSDSVIEFTAAHDAPIDQLFSFVGNSDVPYPVALSATDVYFMLDHVTVPRARFGAFADWMNGYEYFYDELHSPAEPQFEDMVVVHERPY